MVAKCKHINIVPFLQYPAFLVSCGSSKILKIDSVHLHNSRLPQFTSVMTRWDLVCCRCKFPWYRCSASVLRNLTDAAVWEPEYIRVQSVSTTLQCYQSLLHVLLLTARWVTSRYRAQTTALACAATWRVQDCLHSPDVVITDGKPMFQGQTTLNIFYIFSAVNDFLSTTRWKQWEMQTWLSSGSDKDGENIHVRPSLKMKRTAVQEQHVSWLAI
jgi:hypothetical protein